MGRSTQNRKGERIEAWVREDEVKGKEAYNGPWESLALEVGAEHAAALGLCRHTTQIHWQQSSHAGRAIDENPLFF